MNTLWQDIRYAVRTLAKAPAFTAIAILTLALGIGANTAIFSVVNAVLLRPLSYRNSGQLVYIWARSAVFDFPNLGLSVPDINDIRAQNTVFSDVAIYQLASKILTGHGAPQTLYGYEVSAEYFPTLGVQLLYGRIFQPGEMQAGQDREIILSYKLWREQFGDDPRMVGKTITLDRIPYTVIGIMPPQFHFPYDYGYAVPLVLSKADLAARDEHGLPVLARLKPGVTLRQAQAELDAIAARLAKAYPDADKNWSFRAVSMKSELVGDESTLLLILFGAVGFVLLIACANVGNLFLSRGWARRRELAIRATLGATRARIIRQLLVESLLLAFIGGACGLLLALWGIDSLRTLLPPNPRMAYLSVDQTVLWFTLGACVIAGILFGLVPTMLVSRQDLSSAMKESGAGAQTGASSSRHNPLRQILVVAEIALALVLVIGATLTLRSLARLLDVNMGFRTDHVLTMRLDFPSFQFAKPEEATNFVQQLLAQTRSLPGVENATAALFAPLSGGRGEDSFKVEDRPSTQKYRADFTGVTPRYFDTLGIPLIAGRDFTADDRKNSVPVYIVNRALARRVFGSVSPIGKRISQANNDQKTITWAEIVGEVGDTRDRSANAAPEPKLYMPSSQAGFEMGGVSLLIHTKTDPQSLTEAVEQRIWSLEKDQPVTNVSTMDQLVAESDAASRSQTFLLGAFAALGLLLAVVGIYGVISYSVTQRTHEIGIRMALGAEPRQVMRLILAHGLKLALIGVAIGIGASFALTRLMASLLFGVSATDPLTFASVAILLTVVSLAACYVPARRAMRVDPMVALRYE
ncbi:MAG: ABC transporter permease [Candidatus Acidiferrales bacterium]